MTKVDISLECRCGALKGVVAGGVAGPRMICLCDDCQAYAHYLRRSGDILDANGGTDIFPVRPANLDITQGIENLKCVRLSGRGMFRWYAGCCNTPVANSMPSPKFPFAGVFHLLVKQGDAGPVRARVQGKHGIGTLPEGTLQTVSPGVILRTLAFLLPGFIRRQHRPSPFFDDAGRPIVEPYVLPRIERESLRPLCGPRH